MITEIISDQCINHCTFCFQVKKHHKFDTASGILKNVNRKGTFPIKGQDLKTEREQPEALDDVPQYSLVLLWEMFFSG
jgi:hypothetical protein